MAGPLAERGEPCSERKAVLRKLAACPNSSVQRNNVGCSAEAVCSND